MGNKSTEATLAEVNFPSAATEKSTILSLPSFFASSSLKKARGANQLYRQVLYTVNYS